MEKWLMSLMLQSEVVRDFTTGRLGKEDFQNSHYGFLYQALCSLPKETIWEVPVIANKLGFTSESEEQKELQELRGYSFSGMFDCKRAAAIVPDAVDQLVNVSKRRFIRAACTDLANLAESPTADLSIIEADLSEMQKKLASGEAGKTWAEHTMDWIELLEFRFEHRRDRQTIGTGMPTIDRIIGQFGCGHLVVISARYKVGKSAFVLGIINHATINNKVPGLILSLEMSRVEWLDRLFAHRSGVDSQRISQGTLLEGDFAKITGQAQAISQAPLFCEDRDCYRMEQIMSLIRFYKVKSDIQYAVIDHAQLVQYPASKAQQHEKLGDLTSTLKAVAKQLGITIFCLSQTNADGSTFGSRTMIRANLDKEIHITIPEDEEDDTNLRDVNVELNRNGRTGNVKAFFDGPTLTFREIRSESKNGYSQSKDA
jgi:replicative DNA helicase